MTAIIYILNHYIIALFITEQRRKYLLSVSGTPVWNQKNISKPASGIPFQSSPLFGFQPTTL
jgi:hypothetical protein